MISINLSGPGINRNSRKVNFKDNLAHIKRCAESNETANVFRRTFKDGLDDFYKKFHDEASWHALDKNKKIEYLSPILERAEKAFKESLIIFNTQGEAWDLRSESFALEWLFCCLVHLSPDYDPTIATDIAAAAGFPLRNPI